jgi:CheY-like chemotaxis protein
VNPWIAAPHLIFKPRRETATQSGKRVLLVIRNVSERRAIAEELTKAGYIVVAKDNCHDALRFCRESAVLHALVTETTLPHRGGIELGRSTSQCHSHLVIVCVCSGNPKPSVVGQPAYKCNMNELAGTKHPLLSRSSYLRVARRIGRYGLGLKVTWSKADD